MIMNVSGCRTYFEDQGDEGQINRETERQRDRESRPNPLKDPRDSREALRCDDFRRLAGDLHSVATQASFSIALRSDFKAFGSEFGCSWGAKMDAKIDSGRFFCDAFVERVQALILRAFLEARNLKIMIFLSKINDFHQIDVFEKVANNDQFWLRFWKPKRRKID